MSKMLSVMRYEYRRHVLRRGFLIAVFSIPFWILLTIGLVMLIIWLESGDQPLGYVDQAGFLENAVQLPAPDFPDRLIPMESFDSVDQAQQALDAGDLQAYFVLPADYPANNQVDLVYIEQPGSSAVNQFRDYLRLNLLADLPEPVVNRLIEGADLQVETLNDESQAAGFGLVLKFLLPLFSGLALMVAVFTSSGYLMQAVVDEKENRTMEIMITSLSPAQMMAGKVIGLIGVGLTQILLWMLMAAVALFFVRQNLNFFGLSGLDFSGLWLALAVIIPAFVMISALMAAVGATVTEAREGQQVTGLITLPVMLPFFLFAVLLNNPNGPIAVAFSFFPLTAPLTLIIRSGFAEVPTWQLAVSLLILVLSAVGSLWLAGQIFRLGMLRYGQRVRLREVFDSLRPNRMKRVEG